MDVRQRGQLGEWRAAAHFAVADRVLEPAGDFAGVVRIEPAEGRFSGQLGLGIAAAGEFGPGLALAGHHVPDAHKRARVRPIAARHRSRALKQCADAKRRSKAPPTPGAEAGPARFSGPTRRRSPAAVNAVARGGRARSPVGHEHASKLRATLHIWSAPIDENTFVFYIKIAYLKVVDQSVARSRPVSCT